MIYSIGQNCHITLAHQDIDAGAAYGFLCPLDDSIREAGVQLVREVVTPDAADPNQTGGISLFCHFDILMSDDAIQPDGTLRTTTRAQDYAKLVEFLDKKEGISLETPIGTILNLGSLGWSADERHTPHQSIVKCQLNNVGYYFPPVPPEELAKALWGDAVTLSLAWDDGYWR